MTRTALAAEEPEPQPYFATGGIVTGPVTLSTGCCDGYVIPREAMPATGTAGNVSVTLDFDPEVLRRAAVGRASPSRRLTCMAFMRIARRAVQRYDASDRAPVGTLEPIGPVEYGGWQVQCYRCGPDWADDVDPLPRDAAFALAREHLLARHAAVD